MQNFSKQIFKAIIAVAMLLPLGATAQGMMSSINTYSPYSMYGLGELATPGNVATRSMGGVGVAMLSTHAINMLNPAGYANMNRKSFIFNFGIDAGHYRNSQNKYSTGSVSEVKTAYNSANIHEIAFQMPLAKNVGFGFSLTPYSNVGYNMYSNDLSSDIIGNVGRVQYRYYGDGDITEVKVGAGWRPFTKLSIGAAARYYWGNITRNYKTIPADIITGSGTYSNTTGIDTYDVSNVKFQFGIQWHAIMNSNRALSFGATYDLGGDLNPDMTQYVYVDNFLTSVVRDQTDALPLRLPQQVAAGVFYQTSKIRAGVDYVYQNWGSENTDYIEGNGKGVRVAYTDTHTIKAGFEIRPRPTDVSNYLNRISYRVGLRYGDYYQTFAYTNIKQYAVTAGFGLPLQLFGNSSVDIGFEWGMRDPQNEKINLNGKEVGLVKQNYYKLAIGLSLFGNDWFRRRQFN